MLLGPLQGAAQLHVLDGDNCDALGADDKEWPLADAAVDTDARNVNGSSDAQYFWGAVEGPDIVFAIQRPQAGAASFKVYLNTDCNATNNDVGRSGSDVALFFSISGSGVISNKQLWEWDASASDYVLTTITVEAEMGRSTCTDNTTDLHFAEMSVALSDIFTLCDAGSGSTPACGSITVTRSTTHAGLVFNSAPKDTFFLSSNVPINFVPTADMSLTDSVACLNETISLDGLASLDGDETNNLSDFNTYSWDVDYNGTFNEDYTGSSPVETFNTPGLHTVALIVTDAYGCKDTAISDINVYGRPTASATMTYSPVTGPVCQIANFDGSGSTDNHGANNMTYSWTFGDGNTSVLATGNHPYTSCASEHNATFTVTDPDNHDKCAADVVLFTVPLPVELISFDAKVNASGKNTLNWKTASELNNKGFYILRSLDGSTWSEVDFVKGSGTTHSVVSYQWTDMSATKAGAVYYKLKQEDFNGTVTLSESRSVVGQKVIKPVVYPNPVESKLNINLGVIEESQIVTIDIVNQFGQSVSSQTQVGVSEYAISVQTLASGVYYAKVNVNGVVYTHKFLKK